MEESKNWREWLSEYHLGLYDKWKADHIYETYYTKTTFVLVTLGNGFQITGTSHCEDPSKFSETLGHKYALIEALNKLGQLDAFYNAQMAYEKHSKRVAQTFEPKDKHITFDEANKLIYVALQDYDREARSRFKSNY